MLRFVLSQNFADMDSHWRPYSYNCNPCQVVDRKHIISVMSRPIIKFEWPRLNDTQRASVLLPASGVQCMNG